MHPHTYYSTLFDHEKRDEVFVIMGFGSRFFPRWRDVIEPCIREDLSLKPVRVDERASGDSIVTDILDGIAHARLVIADITSTGVTDGDSIWPQRGANVMWELGIAHTMRLPDEVVVVRSDNDPSLFDLTQFRAFPYDPTDPREARRVLSGIAKDRLRVVNQARSEHVARCLSSLDFACWRVLYEGASAGQVDPPVVRTMGDAVGLARRLDAVARLLTMGVLRTVFPRVTPDDVLTKSGEPAERMLHYEVTDFGRAVYEACVSRMGLNDPDLLRWIVQRKADPADGAE